MPPIKRDSTKNIFSYMREDLNKSFIYHISLSEYISAFLSFSFFILGIIFLAIFATDIKRIGFIIVAPIFISLASIINFLVERCNEMMDRASKNNINRIHSKYWNVLKGLYAISDPYKIYRI